MEQAASEPASHYPLLAPVARKFVGFCYQACLPRTPAYPPIFERLRHGTFPVNQVCLPSV
jgi:hypothetical protein